MGGDGKLGVSNTGHPGASLNGSQIPQHVAIIMDGNGRWAQSRGLERIEGHQAGAHAVRKIVEECRRLGIKYLTLFSFSTENWQRDPKEVSSLMELFAQYLNSELETLKKNGVRLTAIGDLARLPESVKKLLSRDIAETEENAELTLVLAMSYGAREEIVAAARSLAEEVETGKLRAADITAEKFAKSLWSRDIPDPDLLIRTSGEMRVSNFLLYQIAYAEIIVRDEFWPDFNEERLRECLADYSRRERRFGLTSEQLAKDRSQTRECRETT